MKLFLIITFFVGCFIFSLESCEIHWVPWSTSNSGIPQGAIKGDKNFYIIRANAGSEIVVGKYRIGASCGYVLSQNRELCVQDFLVKIITKISKITSFYIDLQVLTGTSNRMIWSSTNFNGYYLEIIGGRNSDGNHLHICQVTVEGITRITGTAPANENKCYIWYGNRLKEYNSYDKLMCRG